MIAVVIVATSDRTDLMAGTDVAVAAEIFVTRRPTRTRSAIDVLNTVSIDTEKGTTFADHKAGWFVESSV